jgi:hypothetical protein|tara:strand:- start:3756 stop:4007 length:252 start_codon:yes stop_codon:yes gene_type:complete
MYKFKVGDLIAKKYPNNGLILKTGIVLREDESSFIVKWTSYNKEFFMEKENNMFSELNNLYLLSIQSINRHNEEAFLYLLNPS